MRADRFSLTRGLTICSLENLVSHLRTSDARYRTTVPADAVAVGAARGTPCPPFFQGCSPSPLAPSYASAAAAADVSVAEDVGAASASAKRRSSKGKGGRGSGGGSGGGGGGSGSGGGGSSSPCTCPGSSLYTLAIESLQVVASAQVSALGQVAAFCSCCLLSHQTLLWHHRLGHPSLPRLRGMHSRFLVSGLPRSLPPLPPSPAPPCLPCVEGRQRAAPHSSSFPPMTAPLQTLHMDVWGPARISGQGRERYFLIVVDDYTRYTTVFPFCCKGEVVDVLIHWIRTFRLQLRERFGQDLPRRIGLVMEVARTSMIHAAAPHFLWPFVVRYVAHQLNLWPRVSLPETSPTLRWMGEFGDALVFRVSGSRAFVCDTSADKLSARAIPCVFLGFVPDAPGWRFYHPTSRRVLPSQDVMFDESVPFYRATRGAASGGATSGGAEPAGSGSEGAGSGSIEPGGEEPGGAEPEVLLVLRHDSLRSSCVSGLFSVHAFRVELPELEALETLELEVLELLLELVMLEVLRPLVVEVLVPGVLELPGLVVETLETLELETLRILELLELEALALVAPELEKLELEALPQEALELQELELLTLELDLTPLLLCPLPDQSHPPLLSASPLPAPSRYTEQSIGLTERREPASCPFSSVRTAHRIPRSRPPPVPGTHTMALRPSSVPLHVPLPAPPESSLPEVPDPESDRAHAARPTVSRLLATAVSDPSFEFAAASALVVEMLEFAAACCLDYATSLVAESASASRPSVGGECALGTDFLEDRLEDFEFLAAAVPRFASMLLAPKGDPNAPDIPTPRSYAEAITGPYSSQWQAAMDAEMAS
ncbi:unnamed protein product [Closterium sp. NIES-53]